MLTLKTLILECRHFFVLSPIFPFFIVLRNIYRPGVARPRKGAEILRKCSPATKCVPCDRSIVMGHVSHVTYVFF